VGHSPSAESGEAESLVNNYKQSDPMYKSDHSLSKKARAAALEKLKSSGITEAQSEKLKIETVSCKKTAKLFRGAKTLDCLKLNYFGPDGKPLSDIPEGKPFFRVRYLEDSKEFGGIKSFRYSQPPNTLPVTYFPQGFTRWGDIIDDAEVPLVVTEGELKAAKASIEGFNCIGLGGVHNWRALKKGVDWLPSLDLIKWERRNVYVCFDSDYRTNPAVCSALKSFADALHQRGAFAYLVSLPQLPGLDKVGLDDYLVAQPNPGQCFEELLYQALPLGITKPLFDLNKKYVYIKNPGFIVDQSDMDNKLAPGAFKEHHAANCFYQEQTLKADGEISYKKVPAAAAWLKWPLRSECKKVTYAPGEDRITREGEYNVWPGWGCKPKRGNIDPFRDLMDHLFQDAEPQALKWFLKWCAYPLQNPGAKMFSAVVVHGIRQGTGKSLVGYTLKRIYGKNFRTIRQGDVTREFSGWAENKQFVMGDDITGSKHRRDADFLKTLITQEELCVNIKNVREFWVPDCINYYFTSQHADAFFLEDDDRRYFIHEVTAGPKEMEFYQNYKYWLDHGGAEALFHYLLGVQTIDFDPSAPAYRTAAKQRMILQGQSDLSSWAHLLMENPDGLLGAANLPRERSLYTSGELLTLYDPGNQTKVTATGMSRALTSAGFRQICDGRPIKLRDGSQGRYFEIREPQNWRAWTQGAAKNHIEAYLQLIDDNDGGYNY